MPPKALGKNGDGDIEKLLGFMDRHSGAERLADRALRCLRLLAEPDRAVMWEGKTITPLSKPVLARALADAGRVDEARGLGDAVQEWLDVQLQYATGDRAEGLKIEGMLMKTAIRAAVEEVSWGDMAAEAERHDAKKIPGNRMMPMLVLYLCEDGNTELAGKVANKIEHRSLKEDARLCLMAGSLPVDVWAAMSGQERKFVLRELSHWFAHRGDADLMESVVRSLPMREQASLIRHTIGVAGALHLDLAQRAIDIWATSDERVYSGDLAAFAARRGHREVAEQTLDERHTLQTATIRLALDQDVEAFAAAISAAALRRGPNPALVGAEAAQALIWLARIPGDADWIATLREASGRIAGFASDMEESKNIRGEAMAVPFLKFLEGYFATLEGDAKAAKKHFGDARKAGTDKAQEAGKAKNVTTTQALALLAQNLAEVGLPLEAYKTVKKLTAANRSASRVYTVALSYYLRGDLMGALAAIDAAVVPNDKFATCLGLLELSACTSR